MNLIMFSLFDTKTGTFATPFFMNHRGAAFRAVMDVASDMTTSIGRHPADYALYELGLFDDQTGRLEPCHPLNLGSAVQFLPSPTPAPLFPTKE